MGAAHYARPPCHSLRVLTCSKTAAAVMAAGASNCALMGSASATVTLRGMSARASSAEQGVPCVCLCVCLGVGVGVCV